jgi:hypothetical protein
VTNPDLDREDERFENYLRQFRPLVPEALPARALDRGPRRWVPVGAWAAAAALVGGFALAVVIFLVMGRHPGEVQMAHQVSAIEERAPVRPLTIGSANALLVQSPSVGAALDQVTFHSQLVQPSKGNRSALAVLSEATDRL